MSFFRPRQNQPGHQGNLVLSGAPGGGDTSIPDDVRAGDDVQGQSRVPSPDGDHGRSHVSPTDNTSNSKKWVCMCYLIGKVLAFWGLREFEMDGLSLGDTYHGHYLNMWFCHWASESKKILNKINTDS